MDSRPCLNGSQPPMASPPTRLARLPSIQTTPLALRSTLARVRRTDQAITMFADLEHIWRTVDSGGVRIGRTSRPFPPSKRYGRLSTHTAFQFDPATEKVQADG